ncbi:SusC/RagA family TonB-linked outer membrane protein [Chitinophaga lutea]
MKRRLLSVFLLLCVLSLHAQEKPRSGLVTDELGIPLERVSVQLKGTTTGSFTDAKGHFSIKAADNGILVFTMVGFNREELPASAINANFSLRLTKTESQLTEVVVTALGVNRGRNQMPYAVQTIQGDEVARNRTPNFLQGLSGKIAGLNVQQPNTLGGSTNMTLRGVRSINGDNQALFVVDGVPFSNANNTRNNLNTGNSDQRIGRGGYDYGSMAADFNPDDIASITVLKGAAATALYGSQGANGVILITTKKGKGSLGVTINTGATLSVVDKSTMPKFQDQYGGGYFQDKHDPSGYFYWVDINGDGQNDRVVVTGDDASYGAPFDPELMVYQWDSFDPSSVHYGKPRPWVAGTKDPTDFFRKPVSSNVSAFVDGSNDKGSLKLGLTRTDENGIVENSRIIKNMANFSGTLQLSPKLSVGAMANFAQVKGKGRFATGYDGDEAKNVMTSLRQWWQTNVDIKEQRAAYFRTRKNVTWNWKSYDNLAPNFWNNPYWSVYENYENDTRNRTFGNVHLNYKAAEWLNIMGRVSLDTYDELREERNALGSTNVSKYARINRSFRETNLDLLANMDKNFGTDINFKAVLGTNVRKQLHESIYAQTNGGLISPGVYSLSNSLNALEFPDEYVGKREVQGVFGGVTLTWKDMLSLDGTMRRDASSTLPKGNNVYYYPSVSGGFTFSKLLPATDWLTYGKIRANYAQVGSDAPINIVKDTYLGVAPIGPRPQATVPSTKNNSDLKPERTNSVEAGLEMSFLKGRVGFDVTWYKTNTIDQIMPIVLSTASGYAYRYLNSGIVENKGWELSINATPVRTADFSWSLQANWSANRNKVVKLYGDADNFQLASFQGSVSLNAAVGKPFGIIRGYDYVYTNGQRTIDEDGYYMSTATTNEIIGDPNPDWIGGINNLVRYKELAFSFLIDVRHGGDVFSLDQYFGLSQGLYRETALLNDLGHPSRAPLDEGGGVILPGVTEDGKVNETRVPNDYGLYGDYHNPHKGYVYDASFVKLREAMLTYSLPQRMLQRLGPVKGLDFSLIGRNLWIIHKNLPNADPEDSLGAGNLQGYQTGAYPNVRTVALNLKFKF